MKNYEIIEWNEDNFNIDGHPFVKKAYDQGHWAFVADYVRLWVLKREGGIYLDTDMEVIKSLDPLLENRFFIGKENEKYINAGIIGSEKDHPLLKKLIAAYDTLQDYETIPKIITPIIEAYPSKGVVIYEPSYFYPFYPFGENRGLPLMYSDIKESTYAIHHWEGSWDKDIIHKGTGICVFLDKLKKRLRRWKEK